jgi:hypothetical protein
MPKGVGYGKKGMKKLNKKGGSGKNMGRKRFGSFQERKGGRKGGRKSQRMGY